MRQQNITDKALARLQASKGIARGATTKLTEEEQRTGNMTVCTLNIAGLIAVKLHYVLHHIHWNAMDVMVLINAQLTSQQGR